MAQDRTSEFRAAAVAASRVRGLHHPSAAASRPPESSPAAQSRAAFKKNAAAVARDIATTTEMLTRLSQLARRKALFDDKPQEVAELTVVIKQKVDGLKEAIRQLDEYAKGHIPRNNDQAQTHSKNVVVALQGKLKEITGDFAEVLEARSRNIQASRSRSDQFVPSRPPIRQSQTDNPLYSRPDSRASVTEVSPQRNAIDSNHYAENPYAAAVVDDPPTQSPAEVLYLPQQEQQVALLEEQQSSYLDSRSTAVDAIESTIQELGSMFAQLSTMIAEQRETVQRIDMNTEDISLSVSGAQRELLKYYARVSSNRWLMLKSFGIIIIFFLLWVLIT